MLNFYTGAINRAVLALKIFIVVVLLGSIGMVAGQKTAKADVILPDQKAVDYCYTISNLKDFPDYLIIESFFRVGGPEVIKDGVCKEEIKNNAGNFYATKKAGFDASQLPKDATNHDFFTGNSTFLPAKLTLSPTYVIDKDSPVVKVQDVLKIVNITSTELQLEKSSVIYTYNNGTTEELPYRDQETRPAPTQTGTASFAGINLWWYLLVPVAALVAVAFIVIRNNRKNPKREVKWTRQ